MGGITSLSGVKKRHMHLTKSILKSSSQSSEINIRSSEPDPFEFLGTVMACMYSHSTLSFIIIVILLFLTPQIPKQPPLRLLVHPAIPQLLHPLLQLRNLFFEVIIPLSQ